MNESPEHCSFYLEGNSVGRTEKARPWDQPYHLFCPSCGRIWFSKLVEGTTYHHVHTAKCRQCGDGRIIRRAGKLMCHEARPFPYELLQREFLLCYDNFMWCLKD